jgi:orotate phosphoribosyltransferase
MADISRQIAQAALEIGAIRLQPRDPFTWTSGYRMPIYNDNRMLLGKYENRCLVAEGFASLLESIGEPFDLVAGTATAGISPATTLADLLKTRFAYVRKEAKGHGTQSRIEGILERGDRAVLVEDLISTGGSSISAVSGLRDAGAEVKHCLAIFNYEFKKAADVFAENECSLHPLLGFEHLLEVAREAEYISGEEQQMLSSWSSNPFGWGEEHGFPKVEK